ncbi:hypothetical protein [Mucilaginibacter polytrichastri]|uniref:Uncharacterized protein n=1 Tax=Mucilaginibacter polytrichastri TaxID=1302689 RepID=A0A1Q5ZTS5_9SPHI|nr:hypothetical protein [Mucilaginibacter polytrichastri]OKS85170.1 hypothetical protein RG47T_0614 [Mucilaginibacter polytrichastri]SFS43329.1 hypothetical protein SAMN04487890_101470 [Mucilaginibacter polytrichastri]
MELQENDDYIENPQEDDNYDIEIYSKRAIWGFSIFFSTIFGGVLLMTNLREAGYKREANLVLIFSVLYTLIGSVVMSYIGIQSSAFAIIFNGIGAAILTEYFFNKYFPEDDYFPKSITKPLIISLVICVAIVLFVYNYAPKGMLPVK